jgi:hypothetical protein
MNVHLGIIRRNRYLRLRDNYPALFRSLYFRPIFAYADCLIPAEPERAPNGFSVQQSRTN